MVRMRRRLGIGLVCVAALAGAAVYASADRKPPAVGEWERLPAGPLSPRDGAIGVWTGREVIVFGGRDEPSCPNCSAPLREPLRDGAAFDPATRSWRRIADAPVAFDVADTAIAGGQVHVSSARGLFAYSVADDRWSSLPAPPRPGADGFALIGAGDRVYAHRGGWIGEYDPATRRWRELPRTPAHQLVWSGEKLVAIDCVDRPEEEGACLVTGSVLEGERWERLPASAIDFLPGHWGAVDGRVLSASVGDSNSQRQWVGEPAYPTGGMLDVEKREWSFLPDPPEEEGQIWAGALGPRSAVSLRPGSFVLDLERDEWLRIPELNGFAHGRTMVEAGRSLFVLGGTRNLELLRDSVWMWTPPPR